MRFLKKLTLVLLLSGCAGRVKIPTIEPCTIINKEVAQCTSTDLSVPSRDLPISKMRGYTAFSPADRAKIAALIKKLLADLDQAMVYMNLLGEK